MAFTLDPNYAAATPRGLAALARRELLEGPAVGEAEASNAVVALQAAFDEVEDLLRDHPDFSDRIKAWLFTMKLHIAVLEEDRRQ